MLWGLAGALTGACASSPQVVDPDAEAVCRAGEAKDVLLVRCGRFGLALVPVSEVLGTEGALRAYRQVVEEQVAAELGAVQILVEERPLDVDGAPWPGFSWETPDRAPPRSGRVALGEVPGLGLRLLTCEVRDAGDTAEERCEERMREVLADHARFPRVPVEELKG